MNDPKILFKSKWKITLTILLITSLTFLDKLVPPAGIPIAVTAIFLLFWLRKVPFKNLGLFKPESLGTTILWVLVTVIIIKILSLFVLGELFEVFGINTDVPDTYAAIEGNNQMLITYLIVSWTTAGFGEELIFRAFFMGQMASVFDRFKSKWIISLIISSIIFGFLHYNNGIQAIISTGITGFILGLLYLQTNKNIWAPYFAHAITNTISFLIICTGLYKSFM